jgi:hypothetical protein
MKNFKLFLFGGVFCSLIVSTAVAVERTCADAMPTCEQLGYKWNCSTNHNLWGELVLPFLSCPWDENVKYCPGATKEAENSDPKTTIEINFDRANCEALGFTVTDEDDCYPYISLPCPFDSTSFFCASPEAKLPTVTPGTKPGIGGGDSGETGSGDGDSGVIGSGDKGFIGGPVSGGSYLPKI